MAEPFSPKTELFIDGAWTDITSYVRYEQGVTISRGAEDEQAQLSPSRLALTLNNRDGRFSNRNPSSPYFGKLGRNTPLRLSMTNLAPYLSVTTANSGVVSAPDTAALDITGDLDIRVDIEPDLWTREQVVVAKSRTTSNQRSWYLKLRSNGKVQLAWSTDGLSYPFGVDSPVLYGFGRLAVRATLDVNNGAGGWTVTFYTSDNVNGPWTQLGDPVSSNGVTSIFSSSAALEVGSGNNGGTLFGGDVRYNGKIHRVQVRNGIGGTVVADPDFTAQAIGATSFSDGIQTWTLTGTTEITGTRGRLVAEVPTWPTKWDLSGKDIYVPIEAAGITRRLTQGVSPLRSAIYRNLSQYNPLGYWPLEDSSDAVQAASAVAGGRAATARGITFAGDDTLPGSATAAVMNDINGVLIGNINKKLPVSATGWAFMLFFKLPAIPGAETVLVDLIVGGAAPRLRITITSTGYILRGMLLDGTPVFTGSYTFGAGAEPNRWIAMQLETEYAAGTTTWSWIWHAVGTTTFYAGTGSYAGTPGSPVQWAVDTETYTLGASIAHIYAGENTLPFVTDSFSKSSNGYQGETAIARFSRLCAEEGVPAVVQSTGLDDSAPMGRQRVATFIDLIGECKDADQGLLYEPREILGLGFWPRAALYNGRGVTFDYGTHIAAPFEPVDDDQALRNSVTVARPGGSSALEELEDGSLSIQAPPAGVGRYDTSVEVNVNTDDQLPDLAAWLVRLGTWDALRYPQISLKLQNSAFLGSPTRTAQAALLDVGRRLAVASLPSWLPPEPADCLVQGYTETIKTDEWDITYNTTPGKLWDIAVVESADARADTEGSDLGTSVNPTATTLIVDTTSGPTWSTDPADYPLDVAMGGERIRLNNAPGGSTSPQTFTGVTRSVNGVVKSHAAGADIRLWTPAYLAL